MTAVNLDYKPQPRQFLLHSTKARQILYGGAAGGGKSHSIRWDGIMFCLQNPGCQAYLFRRSYPELQKNHIVPLLQQMPRAIGDYVAGDKAYRFKNGSILWFCHCEQEVDVTKYQGAEMHWVGIDEAAHFTEYQLSYIKTRNRLGGWNPKSDGDRLPRFVMGSNPGGPGHLYLKSIFLDRSPPETVFFDDTMRDPDDPSDKGWPSIFIPAKIADNRYIDKDYRASFGGLPPELARALREGDWDAVVGQALHNLSRTRHQLRPFTPPRHAARFMAIDWGTASPYSVCWFAVSDGWELKGREGWPSRWIPAGALVMYDELYGWSGKPNQGAREAPQTVARKIIQREEERGDTMDYRVGDTEMWANRSGPGPAEWFETTDPRLTMRKAIKDRKRNYAEMISRLAGNPRYMIDGRIEEDPLLFITANCLHFWRTCPSLVLDETDPEKGPETKLQEDHCYDSCVYGLRSRPVMITEEDRYYQEWGEEIRRAKGQVADPYYTGVA